MPDTFQYESGCIVSPQSLGRSTSLNSNTTKSLQPQEQLSRFCLRGFSTHWDPAYIRSEWYSYLLEYFTLGGPLTSAHMAHLFFIIYRPVTNLLYFWSMVGQAGLEPAMLKAPDLQSGGVTNFPTDPDIIIKNARA